MDSKKKNRDGGQDQQGHDQELVEASQNTDQQESECHAGEPVDEVFIPDEYEDVPQSQWYIGYHLKGTANEQPSGPSEEAPYNWVRDEPYPLAQMKPPNRVQE
jgi:hypothetical protein